MEDSLLSNVKARRHGIGHSRNDVTTSKPLTPMDTKSIRYIGSRSSYSTTNLSLPLNHMKNTSKTRSY